MSTRGIRKYKQYLANPDMTVPKTTVWRHKKTKKNDAPDTDHSGSATIMEPEDSRKVARKAYITDNTKPVPHQTL